MGLGDVAGQVLGKKAERTASDPATHTPTTTSTETNAFATAQTKAESPTGRGPAASNSTSPVSPMLSASNFFSIFWITDTQFLSQENPALFRMLTNWIVDNWSRYNGKLVIHTGDIVQAGDDQTQWANANEAMSILLKNGVPYTWCAGNHDDLANGDPTSGWSGSTWAPAFNPTVVGSQVNSLQYASWAGDCHAGMNTAVAFSANGLNFLVVNIEWNAEPDVLAWAEDLLDDPQYAGYHVILAPTHT